MRDSQGAGEDETEERSRHEQAISTLNKPHDRIETFLSSESPRQGKGVKRTEVKSNITDNESCMMTTSKGTIQGYNGIAAADSAYQVIIEARAYGEGQEHHTLIAAQKVIEEKYRRRGISPAIYATNYKVTADTGHGRQVSFEFKYSENNSPNTQWMIKRVDSDGGKRVYSHGISVIEPVFGNLEANKGLRRFSVRSQKKVNTQWLLYCSVHNIEKVGRYGKSFKDVEVQNEAT